MATEQLDLRVLAERPVVRKDTPSEVDLVVHLITSRGIGDQPASHALNLCVVIDRSGSMAANAKLEHAKRSCVEIWENLNPEDHLTVLAFDQDVISIANPQTPRDQVKERILALRPGGSTNLSKGWYLGLLELQSYGSDRHINRLILLSDGQANIGELKSTVLGAESGRARDELGITTSTIGIGADFQEDILAAIARESGGRFWYIGDSGIEDIIREEFSGALSVYLERPSIRIDLPPAAVVVREYHDLPTVAGRYRLRPIKGNDRFAFGVRLKVDPARSTGPDLSITATLLDGTDTISTNTTNLQLGTLEEYAQSPEEPVVAMVVSRYLAAKADEEMVEQIDAGEVSTVLTMLDKQSGLMQEIEKKLAGQAAISWEKMSERERLAAERRRREELHEVDMLQMELRENVALQSVSQLVDVMQGLGADRYVDSVLTLVRKHQMHRSSRKRTYLESPREARLSQMGVAELLRAARAVGDNFLRDYPYARDTITTILGSIDEQLARFP